jgi:hypothetical protein
MAHGGHELPAAPAGGRGWADPAAPLVVLDLASVESYLLVQPLSWLAPESAGAIWCPLIGDPAPLDVDRDAARRIASRLGLSLNWPERHPAPVPRATRLAALACTRGSAASLMFSMTRLAFASAIDLEAVGRLAADGTGDSELYPAELLNMEGELGVGTPELEAGSEADVELGRIAARLAQVGIEAAPALRWQGEVYRGLRAIALVLEQSRSLQPALLDPA